MVFAKIHLMKGHKGLVYQISIEKGFYLNGLQKITRLLLVLNVWVTGIAAYVVNVYLLVIISAMNVLKKRRI